MTITLIELDLIQDHLLKPPPRDNPLANFIVLAISGAVLGFLGADATLGLELSFGALLEARVGSIKDGRPPFDSALDGALKGMTKRRI